jgi:hypothetical protein
MGGGDILNKISGVTDHIFAIAINDIQKSSKRRRSCDPGYCCIVAHWNILAESLFKRDIKSNICRRNYIRRGLPRSNIFLH